MGTNAQRVRIENGVCLDEHHNRLDLDSPVNADIKEAMNRQPNWSDGTYRFDKTSKSLISDEGGGLRP